VEVSPLNPALTGFSNAILADVLKNKSLFPGQIIIGATDTNCGFVLTTSTDILIIILFE
jgi:hypothetical protein